MFKFPKIVEDPGKNEYLASSSDFGEVPSAVYKDKRFIKLKEVGPFKMSGLLDFESVKANH